MIDPSKNPTNTNAHSATCEDMPTRRQKRKINENESSEMAFVFDILNCPDFLSTLYNN